MDMHFAFLGDSIESVVEISVEAKHSSEMKISTLTSGLDDEIALYDGTFCGSGTIVRHFIAVRLLGELHISSKLDGSLYSWTFKPGVGILKAPAHPVSDLTQFVASGAPAAMTYG
ncbi:hypothetical protein C2845_PM07G13790 [Panicum miliaceum]|uniref:Uncharacterized protein n=1 Tax=Panicum miliaceum TaxID=4540 RepID=A0A3L6SQY6_PANMI|nr:hypothetical protein C2845_PM07G13790 [Panicum miliaceum]